VRAVWRPAQPVLRRMAIGLSMDEIVCRGTCAGRGATHRVPVASDIMVGGCRSFVAAVGIDATEGYVRIAMRCGFMMCPDEVGLLRIGAVAGR
jgi:hypothetical protein